MLIKRYLSTTLWPRIASGLAFVCLAAFLVGCKTPTKPQGFTFYPPAPDEPRIQYLTSFSSESDFADPNKFSEFVLGGKRIHRPIYKPYGIFSRPGKLYVADTQLKNVSTIDLEKRTLRYLRPTGPEGMRVPINVVVDELGLRYVSDTARQEVLIYDTQDKLKTTIGRGQGMKPCGLALFQDKLYVTDLSNHCVRVFHRSTLKEIMRVPQEPADEKSKLLSPTNISVDSEGTMYVSDTGGFVVQVYDSKGVHLRTIGEMGITPGRFALSKGIGVTRDGLVYVVDSASSVVQVFDKQGRILMYFGQPDTAGGLYLPAGLRVDYDNLSFYRKYAAPGYELDHLIFVTNQAGTRKVNVFGFLKKK